MAIENLKRHTTPDIDQIPAQKIQTGEEQFILRTINLLILFRIRRNFLRNRSRSLYVFIGRVVKQIVVIREHITFASYIQNFIQHHTVKINPIGRGNNWGPTVWISTQQINH